MREVVSLVWAGAIPACHPNAPVAQRQCNGFVNHRSRVRVLAWSTNFMAVRPGWARVALNHVEQSSTLWTAANGGGAGAQARF